MRDRKKRLLELGKDIVILLLIVSALFLGQQSGMFNRLRSGIIAPAGGTDGGVSTGVSAAAAPFSVAVVGESVGGRCGLTYGAARVGEVYERFSAALGEALGSSGEPEPVEESAWRAALSGPGVYFDYLYDQPLSLLAVWLGTEIDGGAASHTARRLCLALEEDGPALYYVRALYGEYYRCETALSASAMSARLQEYPANGALFAFELNADTGVDAYALLEPGLQSYARLTSVNPLRDAAAISALPGLFGFSSVRSYSETDATVFVEGDATLRVSADGTVNYKCKTGGLALGAENMSPQMAVEAARKLCVNGPGASCGAANLGLSALHYDPESDSYFICFEYSADGVPVRMTEGAAAELTVSRGYLTDAVLRYRSYSAEAESIVPLPREQALAAADAASGSALTLTYVDTMQSVVLQWLTA